jgi:guanylate kinase
MNNSRIVIVGAGGSGKDHLRNKFIEKGFKHNVAFTTRPQREGEIDGKDYHFISIEEFKDRIDENFWQEYNIFMEDWYYGTSYISWNNSQIFIKEPHGVSQISIMDRKSTLVIYLAIPEEIRRERMNRRVGNADSVERRIEADRKDFENFTDYDIKMTDPNF